MEFLESIDFVSYVPIVGPRGLFSRKEPLLYNGQRIKSIDLVELVSLLDPETTNKFTTYISKDKIRVDEDKEELMRLLPKTEIKMIEIYNEYPYYTYKKNKYSEVISENKSYLFYMFDEYKSYAAILFLIFTRRINEIQDPGTLLPIIEGICYGYPKEYIKGFYITKQDPLNLFTCIQGRNATKREKDLLYEELQEFESSELYAKLLNKFEEDYTKSKKLIDKIISDAKFKAVLKDVTSLEQACTPDFVVF